MSLPTVTIVGTVRFKETKHLPSGKQITSLMVSCSEKKKDGSYDNLNIKAEFWEKSAQFVEQYFQDGSPIIVTGKLITNEFESNGQKRREIKFHFPQASFVPKEREQQSAPKGYNHSGDNMNQPPMSETYTGNNSDIPVEIDDGILF